MLVCRAKSSSDAKMPALRSFLGTMRSGARGTTTIGGALRSKRRHTVSADKTFRTVSSGVCPLAADSDSDAIFSGGMKKNNWAVFLDLFRRGLTRMESWSLKSADRDAVSWRMCNFGRQIELLLPPRTDCRYSVVPSARSHDTRLVTPDTSISVDGWGGGDGSGSEAVVEAMLGAIA